MKKADCGNMMNKVSCLLIGICMVLFSGCIHEHPDSNPFDPGKITMDVDLELNLDWSTTLSAISSSRAVSHNNDHRIIIEVSRGELMIGRDTVYLTNQEFDSGSLSHRLSFKLNPVLYQIAVWSDILQNGEELYSTADLSEIYPLYSDLNWEASRLCGYATDEMDLREYKNRLNVKIQKSIGLRYAGGRFEIVTTDIEKFLQSQHNELMSGEKYSISLDLGDRTADGFDVYTGVPIRNYTEKIITDDFIIPLGEYDSLTIAEGFIFIMDEEDITMSLTVRNSARMIVFRTEKFPVPMKRGNLTRVTGEFLSDPFNNVIEVDNRWDGEIEIEL